MQTSIHSYDYGRFNKVLQEGNKYISPEKTDIKEYADTAQPSLQ